MKTTADYRDAPSGNTAADEPVEEGDDALAEGEDLPEVGSTDEPPHADGERADEAGETRSWVVNADDHGLRLDKGLVLKAPEFSRSHLQTLITQGEVRVDGRAAHAASQKLRLGQRVTVRLVPTAQAQAFRPEALPLDIGYEDDHLIVLNKPAGLVVHPAPGHWSGTLLNALLAHHPGAAVLPRAGIVHRLDRDTSGVMVVAKTLPAMQALVRAIAARDVRREYCAIAWGAFRADEQDIDAPIGRDPRSRVRMAVVGSGKPSRTTVRVLARSAQGYTAVECRLHTGRTHQIRVHLAHTGHPLVSDALYGGGAALGLKRQALHARRLSFVHPVTGSSMDFEVPLPADLEAAWGAFGALG